MTRFLILLFLFAIGIINIAAVDADGPEKAYLLLYSSHKIEYLNLENRSVEPLIANIKYCHVSPHSRKILYRNENSPELFLGSLTMDKEGKLILDSVPVAYEFGPENVFFALSNDEKRLFWVKYQNRESIAHTMSLSDMSVKRYPAVPGFIFKASWSPDDEKVAFYLKEKSPDFSVDDYGLCFMEVKTGDKLTFPPSLPTRINPWRPQSPRWSGDSRYILYEGSYDEKSAYKNIIVDTVEKAKYQCKGGYWIDDHDLFFAEFSEDGSAMNFYKNDIQSVLKNKTSKTNMIGSLAVDGFLSVYYDSFARNLYFQSMLNKIGVYNFSSHKTSDLTPPLHAVDDMYLICF